MNKMVYELTFVTSVNKLERVTRGKIMEEYAIALDCVERVTGKTYRKQCNNVGKMETKICINLIVPLSPFFVTTYKLIFVGSLKLF